jgi:hypothetical protein
MGDQRFAKWAGFLWPIGGTVLGLLVMPVAIAQYPEFFNGARWILPVSVAVMVVCWVVPLFQHKRAKRLFTWIRASPLFGQGFAIVITLLILVFIGYVSVKLFNFHERHLSSALFQTEEHEYQIMEWPPYRGTPFLFIHPVQWHEDTKQLEFALDHKGEGNFANIEVRAPDARNILRVIIKKPYINPESANPTPLAVERRFLTTFRLAMPGVDRVISFLIDHSSGRFTQTLVAHKELNKSDSWLYAWRVEDVKTGEIVFQCKNHGIDEFAPSWVGNIPDTPIGCL